MLQRMVKKNVKKIKNKQFFLKKMKHMQREKEG